MLKVIQNVHSRIGNRRADGDCSHIVRGDLRNRRPDRGLGRPVHIPEFAASLQELGRQTLRQRFTSAKHLQPGISGPSRLHQHAPSRRRCLHHVDAKMFEQTNQSHRIDRILARGQDHGSPRDERQVELQAGDVERQRCNGEQPVACLHPWLLAHAPEKVDEIALSDCDALRIAGRTGRVKHVRKRLRVCGNAGIVRLLPVNFVTHTVQAHGPTRKLWHRPQHFLLGHNQLRSGVLNDVAQSVLRISRVERKVGRPCLQDA